MPIKTLLVLKTIWLVLAIFWTSIILILCLIDSNELPSLSLKINFFDKIVHFIFHFVYTILWIFYINLPLKNISKTQVIKVIVSSIVLGILIEFLQGSYTTTRKADIIDVLANSTGAILAGLLMYSLLNRIKKLKTE